MNRDWVDKDFYQVLGVGREASRMRSNAPIASSPRSSTPTPTRVIPAAEERFKEVSEAYAILSDTDQRKEYDELRQLVESGAYPGLRQWAGEPVRVGPASPDGRPR